MGLFAAKCAPTATADPYGLRRSAVGMLQVRALEEQMLLCMLDGAQVCQAVKLAEAAGVRSAAPAKPAWDGI